MIQLNRCLLCKSDTVLGKGETCLVCDNYSFRIYPSGSTFAVFYDKDDEHFEITSSGWLLKFISEYDYKDYGQIDEDTDIMKRIELMDSLS
jgi:hypothetical protein